MNVLEKANNSITRNKNAIKENTYNSIENNYNEALKVVEDVLLKNYVSNLNKMEIVPLSEKIVKNNIKNNVLFFKVNEMVYEKEEFATYKFASAFNSLATTESAVFIIIDSDGLKTDFYMGVRSIDSDRTTSSLRNTLENAMKGQFPGIKTTKYTIEEMTYIIDSFKSNSISAVTSVANIRKEDINTNENFVQGLEKLVLSMQGQKYTGIIIANGTTQEQLVEIRKGYEKVYSELSSFASIQRNYSTNDSYSYATTDTLAINKSTSYSENKSFTNGTTHTETNTKSYSSSEENVAGKACKGIALASSLVGMALGPVTGGASMFIGSGISTAMGMAGSFVSKTETQSDSNSKSYAKNESFTRGNTNTDTEGTTKSKAVSNTVTNGNGEAITLTVHDKTIENILARIDKQLKRLDEFESLGMFECAAYFMSDDQYAAEIAASTYKALMRGENSGVEISAINSWGICEKYESELISKYVKNFIHPVFKYKNKNQDIFVTPCSLVSGNEIAIHMGLPRKSVCGLPVIEHVDFGKEVVKYDGNHDGLSINLGKIFNMGSVLENRVKLDVNSLAMHTFITGSTGSGKSNTVYELVRQLDNIGVNYMIIEPAKGEYKNVFGNSSEVNVYGTNPQYSDLLRINPFKFPNGIHVLEHIDRLVEIFNVCWPMYAAMPAVLKDAILQSYETCGWNLIESTNKYSNNFFPTFKDLQYELVNVIEKSAYSQELKSNYIGSLVTRVKSLTNGLNGQIFSPNDLEDELLFDRKVVVDLSRVGSMETKSLIMGILIMRLSEHRISSATEMNSKLKHITVLEEAHNILKRISTDQNMEGSNVAGKSVEMISNAIAEMRTYGEGFIIADQSPSAVDVSAIRNTNTKIIMRLPDEQDRRYSGKAAGLKDEQLDEIAKLPKGVAVVYQNDWVEPVLCKIQKYNGEEKQFVYKKEIENIDRNQMFRTNMLKLLLQHRVNENNDIDAIELIDMLNYVDMPMKNKLYLKKVLDIYLENKQISLWRKDRFEKLSKVISELFDSSETIIKIICNSDNHYELTQELVEFIKNGVYDISNDLIFATAQCLLKNAVLEKKEAESIYNSWVSRIREVL